MRASAEHLLRLASGVGQPAEPSVTQVVTPGGTGSRSDSRSEDPLANMMVPDTRRESGPASAARQRSSGYFTASKLRLPLPSFSSMLPAETDVWSPPRSVSALAWPMSAKIFRPSLAIHVELSRYGRSVSSGLHVEEDLESSCVLSDLACCFFGRLFLFVSAYVCQGLAGYGWDHPDPIPRTVTVRSRC